MTSIISLLLLSIINTCKSAQLTPLQLRVLDTFPESEQLEAVYFIELFSKDVDLKLFDDARWKAMLNQEIPRNSKKKDMLSNRILNAVIYLWKNELLSSKTMEEQEMIITKELNTMQSHISQASLQSTLTDICRSQDWLQDEINDVSWMGLIDPLDEELPPHNHPILMATNVSINNYDFRLTARTFAIATYSPYQIAFLLGKKINSRFQILAEKVVSSQMENLLHLAINFDLLRGNNNDLMTHYIGKQSTQMQQLLLDGRDLYGFTPIQLEELYESDGVDAYKSSTYSQQSSVRESISSENSIMHHVESKSDIDIKPVLVEENFMMKLCVISSVMVIGLLANILLIMLKYSQLLSSFKLVFTVSICNGISWIQCINQYLRYFSFYPNEKYHFFSKYIMQSLAYFYTGIVMLLIFNVCGNDFYFS